MNVLLVVPFHADLSLLSSEAETLINLLQPRRVLQGDVSEERLRETIEEETKSGGPFMGVWFATHSSERELELSDGAIGRDALVQYMAVSGTNWVVLNSCESEGLASGLMTIGIDVLAVAMTDDSSGIADRDALRVAHLVASALRDNGGDLQEAYRTIPHIGTKHRFFPASEAQQATRAYNSNDPNLARLLYELKGKVDALESTVNNRLDALEKKMDEVAVAMDKRPTASQVVGMVLFGCLAVLMFIGLIAYLFQRGIL